LHRVDDADQPVKKPKTESKAKAEVPFLPESEGVLAWFQS